MASVWKVSVRGQVVFIVPSHRRIESTDDLSHPVGVIIPGMGKSILQKDISAE